MSLCHGVIGFTAVLWNRIWGFQSDFEHIKSKDLQGFNFATFCNSCFILFLKFLRNQKGALRSLYIEFNCYSWKLTWKLPRISNCMMFMFSMLLHFTNVRQWFQCFANVIKQHFVDRRLVLVVFHDNWFWNCRMVFDFETVEWSGVWFSQSLCLLFWWFRRFGES